MVVHLILCPKRWKCLFIFNGTLKTFYLMMYNVVYMIMDNSISGKNDPLSK